MRLSRAALAAHNSWVYPKYRGHVRPILTVGPQHSVFTHPSLAFQFTQRLTAKKLLKSAFEDNAVQ